jgi:hypothetical protein
VWYCNRARLRSRASVYAKDLGPERLCTARSLGFQHRRGSRRRRR